MRYLLLLLLMVASCGPKPEDQLNLHIDQEFFIYVDVFEDETGIKVNRTGIRFEDKLSDPKRIGECFKYRGSEEGEVRILKSWWDDTSETNRMILIMHELGHCTLNKGHNDAMFNDGCPKSMMNSYHPGEYCYSLHEDEYWEEYLDGLR
jgi:hypothetical protein